MFEEYIKEVSPPGYEKPNRRKLYSAATSSCDKAATDVMKLLGNFFPLTADSKALSQHAKALEIPKYDYDTDESYRMRVATATYYILYRGTRKFFRDMIKQRFGERQIELVESWMKLKVKAKETVLTEEERSWLKNLFDSELDPNVEYVFTQSYVGGCKAYAGIKAYGSMIRLAGTFENY